MRYHSGHALRYFHKIGIPNVKHLNRSKENCQHINISLKEGRRYNEGQGKIISREKTKLGSFIIYGQGGPRDFEGGHLFLASRRWGATYFWSDKF